MNKSNVNLRINTVAVGNKVPVGRASLESSITQNLHRRVQEGMADDRKPGPDIHIPELRIKAHPSASADVLGDMVAQRISDYLRDHE